ncbi:unnamed protein product [Pleuronectes platessa]|uniref:Uncharacterized protein n=1 Tax=Pleuronectes platessa TaxID=8262 RepID=A0A9N7YTI8_PLEPL|nr:unnamed protein product [Pleuronectes platessa]
MGTVVNPTLGVNGVERISESVSHLLLHNPPLLKKSERHYLRSQSLFYQLSEVQRGEQQLFHLCAPRPAQRKHRATCSLWVLTVNGPIFPVDSESGDATESKFFRLEPSQVTNGCFVARLSRQPSLIPPSLHPSIPPSLSPSIQSRCITFLLHLFAPSSSSFPPAPVIKGEKYNRRK